MTLTTVTFAMLGDAKLFINFLTLADSSFTMNNSTMMQVLDGIPSSNFTIDAASEVNLNDDARFFSGNSYLDGMVNLNDKAIMNSYLDTVINAPTFVAEHASISGRNVAVNS
ncbi:hypothetical protein SAMD00019534_093750 [Acytostelium subglobosum LB1]|uniref:hypothetical protein n=1 Tax=Acytostelium subglobosum LB1 TaxID=1410327 RepID=UPI000644DE97|nr:hypothetical protein SAMD00019534_093750 [Acytostelium subglobosum LB1]GAM26200.1 hypothetical protein SAMD00019534_093750 [Acytostelium subglobosum LB1]|eukprot:XP_012750754.1 hypothetical protein SAMD00019534_093750 [Acytostelium subglobosum LB1]